MKIGVIFAANSIHTGGIIRSYATGIFYALSLAIIRFCTPVWCVNAPTASVVEFNGKGRTVLSFLPKQTRLCLMNKDHTTCLSVNNSTLQTTLTERNTVSYLDFLTEKNAKNKAYAFILANGWLDDFADYCRCSPYEDCIREIFFDANNEDV